MLTATQKIEIQSAHSHYMTAECRDSGYDAKEARARAQALSALCDDFGISRREAEVVSHEVATNYERTLLDAIDEGYTDKCLTPETIDYLRRQV